MLQKVQRFKRWCCSLCGQTLFQWFDPCRIDLVDRSTNYSCLTLAIKNPSFSNAVLPNDDTPAYRAGSAAKDSAVQKISSWQKSDGPTHRVIPRLPCTGLRHPSFKHCRRRKVAESDARSVGDSNTLTLTSTSTLNLVTGGEGEGERQLRVAAGNKGRLWRGG